ncbi:hypothetical protein BVD23_18585 [Salmonella enterica]|nr:hypothetical protein [Salmonella enterica]EBI8101529.1 hypothetical protein [Salmonella enterica]EBL6691325.1 hypothetical protein [Salmonella enterica]EBL8452804.1 hypothetical protein [Salmonella enterica]EDO2946664.1 hypothetical protein [Salmonella enterica]
MPNSLSGQTEYAVRRQCAGFYPPPTHERRPDKHSAIRHSGRFPHLLQRQYAFLRNTEKHDYPG